jgi:hypothetical protein
MDILTVISENIEVQDFKSVKKLINHHFKTTKNKNGVFFPFIINELCGFYMINNKWLLRYVLNSSKPSESRVLSICELFCHLERRPLSLEIKTKICDKQYDIKNYLSLADFSATPAIYKNMNLMYYHIYKKNTREAILYCYELLKIKKFDAIFYVLSRTINDYDYFSMCKQLFF